MDLIIHPLTNELSGELSASPSKSYSHRAFIASSLTSGVSIIRNPLVSGDVGVTIEALIKIGVKIEEETFGKYKVETTLDRLKSPDAPLDCKNSGTTVRFLCALSLLCTHGLKITGEFFRKQRPIIPFLQSLKSLGAKYKHISNGIHVWRENDLCDPIKIEGNVSSQFISALLFITPSLRCVQNEIKIEVTPPIVSYPYINVSLNLLKQLNITIKDLTQSLHDGLNFIIPTNQTINAFTYTIPGDFSSAAFPICASVLSGKESKICLKNLNMNDPQGDKRFIDIIREMGAKITFNPKKNIVIVKGAEIGALHGMDIDCIDIPDLFPILSVLGIFAREKTKLYNISNLKSKESDRVKSMKHVLTHMGVKVKESNDSFTIYQTQHLKASKIAHFNDHRVAMACTIAALFAKKPSQLNNAEIVYDSYPNFFEDLKILGADIRQV